MFRPTFKHCDREVAQLGLGLIEGAAPISVELGMVKGHGSPAIKSKLFLLVVIMLEFFPREQAHVCPIIACDLFLKPPRTCSLSHPCYRERTRMSPLLVALHM